MANTLTRQVESLRDMTVAQLREKYLQVFGEPTRLANKDLLAKRLAWRMQSLAEGGLSERAKRRAEELARDADIRLTIPRASLTPKTVTAPLRSDGRLPLPGTVLTRRYKGRTIQVTVLSEGGFDYDGTRYRSLSAIARHVTGTQWNGLLFFGLKESA